MLNPFSSMPGAMTQVASAIAGLMVAYAMFQNQIPEELRGPLKRYLRKLIDFFYPFIQISFPEFQSNGFERSKAFSAIEYYLNANSTKQAKRLKAVVVRDSEAIVLTMANGEEVIDEFHGVKLCWAFTRSHPFHTQPMVSFHPGDKEKLQFKLTFDKKHREFVTERYLKHVMEEGKAIMVRERRRKIYTNSSNNDGHWTEVVFFHHPATFDHLAMQPEMKDEIIKDLIQFSKSKDYYARIGKAWKRGYLLYGPPGTGKSTMVAAMSNLLGYDIYDLELTAVQDNTELRKLLIDTSSKSIIVIEDIDCSLDLTGQRESDTNDGKEDDKKKNDEAEENRTTKTFEKKKDKYKKSQVTLSGLLNYIDGLWSACEEERIVVFTTNYVEKLDPALIRRGRMDKHIQLSYCGFEAFKILAKNYLNMEEIDDSCAGELFTKIRVLLDETNMSPAQVAENLMPKSCGEDAETGLRRLIKELEDAKEEARLKAEEEAKKKAEEEAKKMAESSIGKKKQIKNENDKENAAE